MTHGYISLNGNFCKITDFISFCFELSYMKLSCLINVGFGRERALQSEPPMWSTGCFNTANVSQLPMGIVVHGVWLDGWLQYTLQISVTNHGGGGGDIKPQSYRRLGTRKTAVIPVRCKWSYRSFVPIFNQINESDAMNFTKNLFSLNSFIEQQGVLLCYQVEKLLVLIL